MIAPGSPHSGFCHPTNHHLPKQVIRLSVGFCNWGAGPGTFYVEEVPAALEGLVPLLPTGMGLLGKCN